MILQYSLKGFLLAFGGAVGQAVGIILSKKGMGDFDPIAATQIRAVAGLICFTLLITGMGYWKKLFSAFQYRTSILSVSLGSVFGPFIGVALSLFAIQQTQTGIASTLMSMVPIFIIVPSAIMFKEKITLAQVIGAMVSIFGASLFFM